MRNVIIRYRCTYNATLLLEIMFIVFGGGKEKSVTSRHTVAGDCFLDSAPGQNGVVTIFTAGNISAHI